MPNILVIDDDATQRMAATLVLQRANYKVLEAVDGVQGLERTLEHRPDLVVCDVRMPNMNGFEFVSAVRADARIADTPIIMLTALANRVYMRIAMTAGADDYIAKPLRANELKDAVATLLARRAVQRQTLMQEIRSNLQAEVSTERENLAQKYEQQLFDALNGRWTRPSSPDELFVGCTLVLADLFQPIFANLPQGSNVATATRQAYISARDTLILHGADHVQPFGSQVLGLFGVNPQGAAYNPAPRAVKAAFNLLKNAAVGLPADSAQAPRRAAVALHRGDITRLNIDDPLHGENTVVMSAGRALLDISELTAFALHRGWKLAASDAFAQLLPVGETPRGRTTSEADLVRTGGIEAVELLPTA